MLDLHLPSGFFELFVEQWICLPRLLSQLLKFSVASFEVGVYLSLVTEIEGDGAIDLFEGNNNFECGGTNVGSTSTSRMGLRWGHFQ